VRLGRRAQNIKLSVRIDAEADEEEILELAEAVDRQGRVHNTLRHGVEIPASECEVVSVEVETQRP
jgi:uncharacterized OsmC-like protein